MRGVFVTKVAKTPFHLHGDDVIDSVFSWCLMQWLMYWLLSSVGDLCSDGCTGFCLQLVPYAVMDVLSFVSVGALCSGGCTGFFSVGALCSGGCIGFCFSWCLMQWWKYWVLFKLVPYAVMYVLGYAVMDVLGLFQLVPYVVMAVLGFVSVGTLCSDGCTGFCFSWCLMHWWVYWVLFQLVP